MEHVAAAERHLAVRRLRVVEVGLYVERVAGWNNKKIDKGFNKDKILPTQSQRNRRDGEEEKRSCVVMKF